MIKSKLRKMDGVTYDELKSNIKQVLNNISIEKYQNIIKGAYVRSNNFITKNPSNRLKKLKNYL
jgi:hypothetical protein